jgi:hypothetical protein|tara:strand:+ start:666 stop:845 length:180 start_codon:yes stop_codon:yes gene_type:complete
MLSTGGFDPYSLNDPFTQLDKDLRGKVLNINKITKKYEIVSKLFTVKQSDRKSQALITS